MFDVARLVDTGSQQKQKTIDVRRNASGCDAYTRIHMRWKKNLVRISYSVMAGLSAGLTFYASEVFAQRIPQTAFTDTIKLTLSEARRRALSGNPDLIAARLDTAVARGQLRQSRVFRFNPAADVLARTNGDELEAGISQEVEIFGQRGTRIAASQWGLAGAEGRVGNATRLVIGQLDRAFYRLASASQRSRLSQEVLALTTRLADIASRQLREGEISRLDYNLAVVELGRARARAIATAREQQTNMIELARVAGLPDSLAVVATVSDSLPVVAGDSLHAPQSLRDSTLALDVSTLTQHAVSRRPDVAERSATIRQAEALLSLSRREALPNPILRAVLEQPTSSGPSTIRPGIGFTLPFLNRNQGDRQALAAAARQSRLEHAALLRTVASEVAAAVSSFRSAMSEVRELGSTVIPPARQNRQLVEIAYREGKVGLPVLLLIQNQAIDAELEYWTAWLVAREAASSLAEATAQNIEGLQVTPTGASR